MRVGDALVVGTIVPLLHIIRYHGTIVQVLSRSDRFICYGLVSYSGTVVPNKLVPWYHRGYLLSHAFNYITPYIQQMYHSTFLAGDMVPHFK